jgi:hypothetical protein
MDKDGDVTTDEYTTGMGFYILAMSRYRVSHLTTDRPEKLFACDLAYRGSASE